MILRQTYRSTGFIYKVYQISVSGLALVDLTHTAPPPTQTLQASLVKGLSKQMKVGTTTV